MPKGSSFGWADAAPGADAAVELMNRIKLFTGQAITTSSSPPHVATHWGHGRLGAYSILWYDFLARRDATKYVSAYVATGGRIAAVNCSPDTSTGNLSGYHITLDRALAGALEVDVLDAGILLDVRSSGYTRAVGTLSGLVPPGGHKPGELQTMLEGKTLLDQLALTG
ncbi:hypothetical protein FB451DRAFT_1571174 [Mycena latifolia]|nr:hypothetical protein FB451DRAFT_1571174 [Mycena latifolia]